MLLFFPPVISALIGAGLVVAGVATHNVILGALGCVGIVVGGARWLSRRGGRGGSGGPGGSGGSGGGRNGGFGGGR
jgi:hypothetical protein